MRPLIAATLLLASCGGYGDFRLPEQKNSREVEIGFVSSKEPILVPSPKPAWDSVDVLNPSLVRTPGGYLNLYSGYDGRTWHTGLATSPDGIVWEKKGRVLSPQLPWEGDYIAANGTALVRNGEILYWYQASQPPVIGLARSKDGRNWTREANPVLLPGPRMSWDEKGVADPYVLEVNGTLYMYYLGQDRARRQRLGVARSQDGIRWEKLRSGPVLDMGDYGAFDETGLGEPAVWIQHGSYWMLYTARDRHEVRRIGLARSQDGIHWTRYRKEPVITGWAPWNEKVVCDPHVEVSSGQVRVWIGGGNRPEPAENLNGAIGYGVLEMAAK